MKTNNQLKQLFINYFRARARRIRWGGLALTLCLLGFLLPAHGQDPRLTNTKYPMDTNVSGGATLTFRVYAASTNGPMSYQWQHEGTNLPAATNVTLVITNVTVADAGGYQATVWNASGDSTNTRTATLTVDSTFVRINEGPGGIESNGSCASAWGDFDKDGYTDLFIANVINGVPTKNAFWHNDGDGTFTKITTNSPALATGYWWYAYWIDYDNDGDLDLHVLAALSDLDRFYRNDGNGVFTPVTPEFVKVPSDGQDCAWSDFDNDGWLDVLIPRSNGKDLFYRGYPDGTFRLMTTNEVGSLVAKGSYFVGASFDYDNDGWGDLLISPLNSTSPCRLYHNDGQAFFRQITEGELANQPSQFPDSTFVGFAVGDYDNDGDFDLMVTSGEDGYRGRLYRNEGNGVFTDVAATAGVDAALNGYRPKWADFDNDGDLDLFIMCANYFNPSHVVSKDNVMFRNNGEGTFTSIEIGSPLRDGIYRCSFSWADYDNDGFLDLFSGNGNGNAECNYLYRNNLSATGSANHWLKVRLVGKASNSMGVGAKVRVTATIGGKTVTQVRQITVPGSNTQEDYLAHFGLGDATEVDTLRIEWPSGIVQELKDVAVDQKPYLTVIESQNPDPLKPPHFTASGRAADGTFQATVTCAAINAVCVLEASTNLVQWTKLSVRANTTGKVQFDDPGATNRPARFYRVVVP